MMSMNLVKLLTQQQNSIFEEKLGGKDTYKPPAKPVELVIKQEAIVATPVSELAEKITNKTLLSKEDMILLTQVMQKEFTSDPKKFLKSGHESEKLRDCLWLAYYALLNTHPLTQNSTYLVREALSKLVKETLWLVQGVLELLTKKSQSSISTVALLYNRAIPPILKILALFMGNAKTGQSCEVIFLSEHYKYLRSTLQKRLNTLSLQSLNQVFTELKKGISSQAPDMSAKKDKDVIQITPTQSSIVESDDFMTSLLEFAPPEYIQVVQQISAQLSAEQKRKDQDETMSQADEEEHKGSDSRQIILSATEQIKQAKLIDLLSHCIENMVDMMESSPIEEFYLIIDSELIKLVSKYGPTLHGFIPNKLNDYMSHTVSKKAVDAKKALQELLNPSGEKMETDEKSKISEEVRKQSKHHSLFLAKSLELIKSKPMAQSLAALSEIFSLTEDHSYLRKLLDAEDTQPVKTIASCLSGFLNIFAVKFPSLDKSERLAYLIAQTDIVFVSKQLSVTPQQQPPPAAIKQEANNESLGWGESQPIPLFGESQEEEPQPKSSWEEQTSFAGRGRGRPHFDIRGGRGGHRGGPGGMQTRSQLKNQAPEPKKQGKQEAPKKAPPKKQQAEEAVIPPPKPELVRIDADDLLKETLTMLSQTMQLYFNQEGRIELSLTALKSFKRLYKEVATSKVHISRLLLGMLSEVTKSKVKYTDQALTTIKGFVIKLLSKNSDSVAEYVFGLKLIFVIHSHGDPTFLSQVAEQLLTAKWTTQRDNLDLQSIPQFLKYITLISCLYLLSQKQNYGPLRQNLVEKIKDCNASIQIMQIALLSEASLAKYKTAIQRFATLSPTLTDTLANQLNSLIGETERINQGLFNTPEVIFDKTLLTQVADMFKLDAVITRLKEQHQVRGGASVFDIKQKINSTLKSIAKITSEIDVQEEGEMEANTLDLEAFIGVQMSLGSTNSEITNFKFEINSTKKMQEIFSKTRQNQELNQEQIDFVDTQLRSIKYFSDSFLQPAITQQLTDLLPNQAKPLASVILQSIRGQSNQSRRLVSLLTTLAGQKSPLELEVLALLVDSSHLEKHVQTHRSNTTRQQESIYAHCLSVCSVDKPEDLDLANHYQSLTSAFILMKVLYINLYQFATALNTVAQYQENVRSLVAEVSRELLRIKFEHPYLELNESGSNFDYEMNDKLVDRVQPGSPIGNKDLLKYRQFEATVQLLSQASTLNEESYKLISGIVGEVASNGLVGLSTKGSSELKLLIAFFKAELIESPLQQTFNKVLSHSVTPASLWTLALRYVSKPQAEQADGQIVSKENKGGLSMEINFNDGAGNKRKKNSKAVTFDESHQVDKDQPKAIPFNPIAQKLFSLITDSLQADTASSDDYKLLSNSFRDAYLSLQEDVAAAMFLELFKAGQQALLKKVLYGLYPQTQELCKSKELRQGVQEKIFRSLVFMMQNLQAAGDDSTESKGALLFVIEIAIIVTESNMELIKFISQEILQGASRLLGGVKGHILKLVVLDLLCQLAQNRFADTQKGSLKYSMQQIRERRKNFQEARKRNEEQRKKLLSQSQAIEDGIEDASKVNQIKVDGFKEDKVNLEESQAKYMELPEEICTYNATKKEFKVQHWYWCFTCKLVDNSGCCAVCANRCHRGHQLVYSKKSNFFCDCGDSGKCKSLKAPEKSKDHFLNMIRDKVPQDRPDWRARDPRDQERLQRLSERGMLFSQHIGLNSEVASYAQPFVPQQAASMFGQRNPDPFSNPNFMQIPEDAFGGGGMPMFLQQNMPDSSLDQPFVPNRFEIEHRDLVEENFRLQNQLMRDIIPEHLRQPMNVLSESSDDDEVKNKWNPNPLGETRSNDRRMPDFIDSNMDSDNEDMIAQQVGRPQERIRKMMHMIKKVPERIHERGGPYERATNRALRDQDPNSMFRERGHMPPQPSMHGGYGGPRHPHELGMPPRMEFGMPHRLEMPSAIKSAFDGGNLDKSESNVSEVNPLWDPMSEAAQAPIKEGDFIQFSQLSSQVEDQEMQEAEGGEYAQDIVEALKSQQAHFEEVFNHLMSLVDDNHGLQSSISQEGKLDLNVTISAQDPLMVQDLSNLLSQPKQSQTLTQDLASVKKNIQESVFKFRLQQQDQSKSAVQQNMNLLDTIDSNRDGLVAICEDQEVNFYAGSQFFEDQPSLGQENFNIGSNSGDQTLAKVETHKTSFQPLAVKYNPLQPQYLAVIGAQQAEVVVLSKQGSVLYRVQIDLLLETIQRDLTIVNAKWVPGSQSLLAVATRQFVKIYNLAVDTLSPIHNIMVFAGQVTDFAFSSPEVSTQTYSSSIYVASSQGILYHHPLHFDVDSFSTAVKRGEEAMVVDAVKNCDLMLTETVHLDKFNIRQGACSILSVHCSQQCKNLLFLTYTQQHHGYGHQGSTATLVGVVHGRDFDGFKLDLQGDNSNNNLKGLWQNYGPTMVAIKDMGVQSDKALFMAFGRRQQQDYTQHGLPLMIQICENKVEVNIVRCHPGNHFVPVLGQAFVNRSTHGYSARRLVNIMVDGTASSYLCSFSAKEQDHYSLEHSSSTSRLQEVNLDRLISRSDLPREVKHSINFYEKAKNVMQDGGLRQKLTIGGDLANYHKTSKATIDKLAQQSNNAQIQENGKKQIRMQLKLENNADMILIGFRLRMDFSQVKDKNQGITVRLFNRSVRMTNYNQGGNANPLWFDFPFCDAESLFASISMSSATFDIISDDPKTCPIRICQLDVFAQSKKDFQYKEKVKKLEKMAADRLAKMQGASVAQLTEQQKSDLIIKEELLQSKAAPLVSWKEKVTFLKNELNKGQVNLIESIDVITQYLSIVNTIDNNQFKILYGKLNVLLKRSYAIKSESELYVIAAIKRCIRKLLSSLYPEAPLGDPNNYQTLKDTLLITAISTRIGSPDLTMLELRKYLKRISKIHDQRYYQLFKILEAQPQLTKTIIEQYLRLFKHSSDYKDLNNDVHQMVSLVVAELQRRINHNDGQVLKTASSITEAIEAAYGTADLASCFNLLQPLLTSEHDIIQKITMSALLHSIHNYSNTMANSLKQNKVPSLYYSTDSKQLGPTVSESKKVELLIVDICPFLLQFAFGLISSQNGLKNELAYQLLFKVAKQFEKNSLEKYEGKFTSHVVSQLEAFIRGTFVNQALDSIQDTESTQNQLLYVNFVLVNSFLHNSKKEGSVKIKDTQVSLTQGTRDKLLQSLGKDKEFVARYIQWCDSLLRQFNEHYASQKGSVRTKCEEGIPMQVQLIKINGPGGNGGKGNLLRPVHESSQWKWHPLFTKTDNQFEYLDRKLPAQILLNLEFLGAKFETLSQVDNATSCVKNLFNNFSLLVFGKPGKALLKPLGESVLASLLAALPSGEQKNSAAFKDFVAFEEFYEVFDTLYNTKISTSQPLSFNLQFLLHSLIQKLWKKASRQPVSWSNFVTKAQPKSHFAIINYLCQSVYLLNDDTAQLCLQLCALAFEQSVVISFRYIDTTPVNLFQIFQKTATKAGQRDTSPGSKFSEIDLNRLVDVMLLGRNKKQIRVATSHFIKGMFDECPELQDKIKDVLIERLPQLRTKGVNSLELMALLSYVINQQIQLNGTQKSKDLYKRLSREIFKQISSTNAQLTSHENLEIYAALQRMTTAFSGSIEMSYSNKEEQLQKHAELALLQEKISSKNQKITNPYLLENEACQKCFSQKSLPFQQFRLNDIKQEAKFTDSTMIYRFNTTYQIKQLTFTQDNFRGNKVIRELQIFVNNKQGVDLADMKKNWSLWQKVKSQELEVGQRQTVIEFTLPVNATNLLLYFITGNTNKPLQVKGGPPPDRNQAKEQRKAKKAKGASEVDNISQVQGLDSVLTTLPKAIACKFGVIGGSGDSDGQSVSQIAGEEQMLCPRCGKQIQGKHGNCNQCGENAMQCTYCRNINYEKPDAYLCNECGNSRFAKFDIGITLKQGFACERIETEEAKTQALQTIESQLQTAQSAYQQLMNKRTMIAGLMKKLNEGATESGKQMADLYSEECADLYLKMMKSLNSIKTLKIEIEQYVSSGVKSEAPSTKPGQSKSLALSRARSCISTVEDEQVQESCFSCIQEYLKGLLNFVKATADSLSSEYQEQGYLTLLYQQNIKMYAAQLQRPARKAICQLVKNDETQAIELLKRIQSDLFSKKETIPAHLLAQNITQETHLIIELLMMQIQMSGKDGSGKSYYHAVLSTFWSIIFNALQEGQSVAPIADLVASTFIGFIKDSFRHTGIHYATELQELQYSLFNEKAAEPSQQLQALQTAQGQYLGGQNYLMFALTLKSSQRVRAEAKSIISTIITNKPQYATGILKHLLSTLDIVLMLESSSGDQYFDLLAQLLSPQVIKEKITELSLNKESETHIFIEAFDKLFKTIESELNKLIQQEQVRASLGVDGFMPQISTGQIFSRVVTLVSLMIKESVHLKAIIQSNVSIVIKSFLKIRKLNLTKNKLIQQSEVEIEKMFKELHCQAEAEKENFIMECIKIIESGDCDNQEMRFLFEEMCKVIDPVKPAPEYFLHLAKAPTQQDFFRGKMSKNPYSISQLGKTMGDVRLKICKEMDLAEPELVELLVCGKLVGMDLQIQQVYEQVQWPFVWRQKNPDAYDIPPIDEAPKNLLQPMQVIFRLMGIDGEAQEDRVDSLQDSSDADSDPANIMKKYGITQVFSKPFSGKNGQETTGIKVLVDVLENFGPLQQQRYLAEWLFKLLGYSLKIKSVRQEFMKYRETVDNFAKRLFESVGMQSQIEGQKGMTLFDVILGILDTIIVELNEQQNSDATHAEQVESSSLMEIDQKAENLEAATHVQLFVKILNDSCNEMIANNQSIDKTSKKIKAVSKILPFLINQEDISAQKIVIDFIGESALKIPLLDNLAELTAKEKFSAQFSLERVIEIIESIPSSKGYFKDHILANCGQLMESMWNYLLNTTLVDLGNESIITKHKLANQYTLRFLHALTKNHPQSQSKLFTSHKNLVDTIYNLTQAKFKDRSIVVLANDIIESLTNKNGINDPTVKEYLQRQMDRQKDEQKKLAAKKREEIMKKMQAQKNTNKFMKQLDNPILQEETGPRCIVCQEGYTKKPTEVLGMYVFSKKLKIKEISENGMGFTNTVGYTTVTHSNFIHFICHQKAYQADSQLKQPKKEWEGAAIRNDHTKCNNLFPLRGGSLPLDSYGQMVDRHFQNLQKTVCQCDNDRVKVLLHDFKLLMKRLAYEDSFSRDTHGGGPEHNMHLVAFFTQMIQYSLNQGSGYMANIINGGSGAHTYIQERKIAQFLEQGMQLKKDFLQKLEEEKKHDDIEEESKMIDEGLGGAGKQDEDDESGQMGNFSLDQIALMLTKCLMFCQLPQWESTYKHQFFSIILCSVAGMKEDSGEVLPKPLGGQTDFATGKRVLTLAKDSGDVPMTVDTGLGAQPTSTPQSKRTRLGSDIKGSDQLNRALIRLRPLLVLLRLVDAIKQRWDGERLNLLQAPVKGDAYMKRLVEEVLAKGNLKETIGECDEIFRVYKDRILRISSVEEFMEDMNMVKHIQETLGEAAKDQTPSQLVEQYVLSHFSS